MVRVYRDEITAKLKSIQLGKRMPLLCSLNRSMGWRIISENYEEHERGIRTEHFDLNKYGIKEDNLTAMSIYDETGIVAVGSGGKDGNLYFILDMSAEKDVQSGLRFKFIHKEVIGAPVHSLDWCGDYLLVGTTQGIAKLYKINYDTNFEISCIGEYVNPISEISMHAPLYVVNSHVNSAEFAPNFSFENLDTLNASCRFLTTTMNHISVWDTSQKEKPVLQYKDNNSLNCASWSPNDPHSLIVCGGLEKKLTIIDTRVSENNGVVWSVEKAHDRPIRDAKFNPFIPYWLASAGEDSVVNIWDIRSTYHGPVAKIDGMMGMVTSVSWSNIRPENIGTTSTGGMMRFWTLTPDSFPIWDTFYRVADFDKQDTLPIIRDYEENNIWCTIDQQHKRKTTKNWFTDVDEGIPKSTMLLVGASGLGEWGTPENGTRYKGEVIVSSKGASVSIKPSKLRPSVYYSITSGGQLAAHTVLIYAPSNIRARHRNDPKTKSEIASQIEDDIFQRRITEAQLKLEILKTTPQSDQQAEKHREEEVALLTDCIMIRKGIKSTEWSIDSLPDRSSRRNSRRIWNREDIWDMSVHTFKADLKYWSMRIPPGYNSRFNFPLELQPIIAPYLLVEELDTKKITPLSDDLRSIYSDIIPIESPPKLKEVIRDEKLYNAFPKGSLIDTSAPPEVKAHIKDRRNMGHIGPIITDKHDSLDQNPFTPPFSANSGDTPIMTPIPHSPPIFPSSPFLMAQSPPLLPILTGTPPVLSNSPPTIGRVSVPLGRTSSVLAHTPPMMACTSSLLAQTPPIMAQTPPILAQTPPMLARTPSILAHTPPGMACTPPILGHAPPGMVHSPIWTSTNPFETCTNPFAIPQETNEAINFPQRNPRHSSNPFDFDREDDHLSVHSANVGQRRRNSWISGGRRLSLTLSNGSDRKRRIFNPLKMLSRRNSSIDSKEKKEKSNLFTAVRNGLKRDSSNRRNAIHGSL